MNKLEVYKDALGGESRSGKYKLGKKEYTGRQILEMMRGELKRCGLRMTLRECIGGFSASYVVVARKGRTYNIKSSIVMEALDYCISFIARTKGINVYKVK